MDLPASVKPSDISTAPVESEVPVRYHLSYYTKRSLASAKISFMIHNWLCEQIRQWTECIILSQNEAEWEQRYDIKHTFATSEFPIESIILGGQLDVLFRRPKDIKKKTSYEGLVIDLLEHDARFTVLTRNAERVIKITPLQVTLAHQKQQLPTRSPTQVDTSFSPRLFSSSQSAAVKGLEPPISPQPTVTNRSVNVLGSDGMVRKQYPSQLTYRPTAAPALSQQKLVNPQLTEQRVEQIYPPETPFRTGGNKFSVIYIDSRLLTFVSAESLAAEERLRAAESSGGDYKLF